MRTNDNLVSKAEKFAWARTNLSDFEQFDWPLATPLNYSAAIAVDCHSDCHLYSLEH